MATRTRYRDRRPWRQTGKNPYTSQRWKLLRAYQLQRMPYCVECGAQANTVDHVVPHRGDPVLFFDPTNLQSLCRRCHNSVKARDERVSGRRGCTDDGLPIDPEHMWHSSNTDD